MFRNLFQAKKNTTVSAELVKKEEELKDLRRYYELRIEDTARKNKFAIEDLERKIKELEEVIEDEKFETRAFEKEVTNDLIAQMTTDHAKEIAQVSKDLVKAKEDLAAANARFDQNQIVIGHLGTEVESWKAFVGELLKAVPTFDVSKLNVTVEVPATTNVNVTNKESK